MTTFMNKGLFSISRNGKAHASVPFVDLKIIDLVTKSYAYVHTLHVSPPNYANSFLHFKPGYVDLLHIS